MRSLPLLFSLLLALAAPPALAQSDATTDPREFSEAARQAYGRALRDARGLIAEKKYAEAIAVLDKLSAERPREPQARFLKGLALADSGQPDAAIVQLEIGMKEASGNAAVQLALGDAYLKAGRFQDARAAYEGVIKKDPVGPSGRQAAAKLKNIAK